MDTIEKKMSLQKRFLAFFASLAVLAGGVVAGVQADTTETGNVQIDVVDENGAPLAGAQLQIVGADDSARVDFESNGQTQELTLEVGSYTLHEVEAPEGYLVADDVSFEVVPSDTVHVEMLQNAPPAEEDVATESENTEDVAPKNETRSAPAVAPGTLSAVYVGGENSSDDNDGSKESPVATWDKAKELVASDGTIYVAGTLKVSGDISTDNPEKQVVKRASGFTGNMFEVTDSAHFTNIHITGNGETVNHCAITFEDKGAGDSLVVGQGVVIDNLVSTGNGAAVYVNNARGSSITFDGAQFRNNKSNDGGAVWVNNAFGSSLTFDGAQFLNNTATALNGGAVSIRTGQQGTSSGGFTVTITGKSLFDGNTAKDEGGAVYLNGQFVTNIDSATFKNNKAEYGAAIVNYNHYIANEINITNGLIVNNKTGGKKSTKKMTGTGLSAGGVNICMAGAAEVNISSEKGVAIFDNVGPKGDIAVWDTSDVSKLKVNEGAMLGGGNHKWTPAGAKGYKANPTEADKARAWEVASVIFENNTSDYHGTIMSNGIVQFGTKLASLRIRKIDEATGQPMNGVVFELTSENGIARTAETFVEAGGQAEYFGVASFTDLPDGKYTLKEVTPVGYRGTMPWAVTIDNGQVTIEDNGQKLIDPVEGKYYDFVIRNQPLAVEISKQALGDDTKELPGAEIVVKDAAGREVERWTSTNEARVLKVEPGKYTLEEVNAPDGFTKITTIVEFEVDTYGNVTVTNAEEVTDGEVIVKDINHLILKDIPTPEVTTDAKDAADGDKYVEADAKARVIDVVTYMGLIPGREYTVTGTLHIKNADGSDGGVLNAKGATVTKTFRPETANGTVELEFEIDASALAGETLVAFESVTYKGKEVAAHVDIDDEDQTVRVVKIGTFASVVDYGKVVFANGEVTVTDTVAYEGLEAGKTYTLKGTLVKKSDGLGVATGEATFVADASGKGLAPMKFTDVDVSELGGDALVAYEYLYEGDVTGQDVSEDSDEFVTKHEEINDADQTVEVVQPEVATSASDKEDGDKVLAPEEQVTVVDKVTYTGLIVGKEYTVFGVLMDKATGEPLVVNGEQVTAEKTFTATEADGEIELEFTFDASALNNKTLVVFETVKYEGKEVAAHTEIDDAAQTVTVTEKPAIGTFAKDGADGDKEIENDKDQTIVDTVKYSNLNTNRTYRVVGVLMDKATGEPALMNGEPITATSADFKPAEANGEVEVTFVVDGRQVAGKDLVVFEKLYVVKADAIDEDKPVVTHEDITDTDQTVHVKDTPDIEKYVNQAVHSEIDLSEVFTYDVLAYVTKDADKAVITDTLNDDLQFVSAVADVKVADLGAKNNHEPNGTVAEAGVAVENAAVVVNGQTLTVTIDPAKDYRGHWVKVTFDAKIADGKTIADLTYATVEKNDPVLTDEQHEGVPNEASYKVYVGNEGKYEDESNTVTVKPAKIGTYAAGSTGKIVFAEDGVTITDTVAYEGLEAGETYTLKGTLVKKSDGSVVATGEATFVAAESGKGMAQMKFTVNASELAGDAMVAYEYLFRGDVTGQDVSEDSDEYVTKHEDINDEAQTVEVTKPEVTTDASDAADGDKIVDIAEDVVINDVVSFSGLIPGKEYTLDGTLHVKDAEQTPLEAKSVVAVAADGATIKDAEARTFVADKAEGTVTLAFTVDTTDIAGEQVVVFESLKFNGKEIAAHADINDEAQTVTVEEEKPEIEKYVNKNVHKDVKMDEVFTYDVLAYVTKDADKVVITDTLNDDLQFVSAVADVTVVDLGATNNHKPNGTVAEAGVAVENATVAINGQTLTVTIDPATAERGHWVKVTFDAKIKDGLQITDLDYAAITENAPVLTDEQHEGVPNKASYEIFVDNKGKYALESNTVTVKPQPETKPEILTPEIGTTATDNADGDKELAVDSDVTVKDLIEYKNLEPNTVYTFKGQLVVKGTDGKDIVAKGQVSFTTDSSGNGTVEMFFNFNTAGLDGKELVAYEYLFRGDVTGQDVSEDSEEFVAKHADDNDVAQTVKVAEKTEETVPPTPTPTPDKSVAPKVTVRPTVKLPVTGLPRTGSAIGVAGLAALLLIGGGLMLRRRND